jgi:hypothetical protein
LPESDRGRRSRTDEWSLCPAHREIQLDLEPRWFAIATEAPDSRGARHSLSRSRGRREQSLARPRGRAREIADESAVDPNRDCVGLVRVVILDDEAGIEDALVGVAARGVEDVRELCRVLRFTDDLGGERATSADSCRVGGARSSARCAEQPAQDSDIPPSGKWIVSQSSFCPNTAMLELCPGVTFFSG